METSTTDQSAEAGRPSSAYSGGLHGVPANRMDGNQLGHVVRAKTGPGEIHAEGVVVTYYDAPAFTIETAAGRRITWKASLCEAMDGWEQAAYWQERARIAESKLATAPEPE